MGKVWALGAKVWDSILRSKSLRTGLWGIGFGVKGVGPIRYGVTGLKLTQLTSYLLVVSKE